MDIEQAVEETYNELLPERGCGRVADYIPALANVDPDRFAITVATRDGQTISRGDAEIPFSIQSISKVFLLTRALDLAGEDLWIRLGREPSGDPFNSIVQLEREKGIPRNPFINAGALVVTDEVVSRTKAAGRDAIQNDILPWIQTLANDDTVSIDADVALSEAATGFRNFSLANFLRSFDNLHSGVDLVLDAYFHQCALSMTTKQLARAALFLASDGQHPLTATRCVSAARARRINAIMLTCGHYDESGDFAFSVGLPGKSGVGGGILCVVPSVATVVVWSPGLTKNGNSMLGTKALARLSQKTGWSVFV